MATGSAGIKPAVSRQTVVYSVRNRRNVDSAAQFKTVRMKSGYDAVAESPVSSCLHWEAADEWKENGFFAF